MRLRYLAVPLLLVLASCGARAADQPAGQSAPDPLRGRTFIATAVTDGDVPHALVPDTELSVEFTDDGRLIARAGCNIMQGNINTANGKLAIDGDLAMTAMGCDPARQEQDLFVAKVLGASPSWQLANERLTITSGTTTLDMAPRETVHPDKDLMGTTWVLDTLVDGDSASSMPAGVPPATLVFDGKRVVADTNCNGFGADYTVTGDTIEFTMGMSTLIGCPPEIARVEQAVGEVLTGKVTFEITADRLVLNNSSGKGIQLHAQ
jgi:heat shock protein HslJ